MIPDNPYLLLTPGPLSTSKTVREAMNRDWCTWDEDYKSIVQDIRSSLLALSNGGDEYSTVLMQGSGTFSVEAVLWTCLKPEDKILVLSNGAYGKRMAKIVCLMGIKLELLDLEEHEQASPEKVEELLKQNPDITHIGMVHSETTTGMLNDYAPIAELADKYNKCFILDAMSSFGGVPLDIRSPKIDFLISSANKCIQGVPGFGFIIARREVLQACKGNSKSHSLDLYDQWKAMENDPGKWRFTSPTHTVRAFLQALEELKEEGGITARYKRYVNNHQTLVKGMKNVGIEAFLSEEDQSPIITAFHEPSSPDFSFDKLYHLLKAEGFVIYPGKVSKAATFRIGHIGHVFPEDIKRLIIAIEKIKFW
ncbi:MAG: 2-aminoethylphosphonate--pyruvate transaminase [Cytophagales bacterium]|uniref:2-aminoethylphosphonate--pyruvate transaminase n=1 Tax=Cyclobacterium marinum TaxID=104 RepID=UPI0030D6EB0E|nr:2-aminoethylphosphonate--pyruvate transaminase [Cytophagales bacterium]|tara:strand:+ start:93755 stop:94852 length:1098 start_codon:yes stop_codon:yes gene_type:complete